MHPTDTFATPAPSYSNPKPALWRIWLQAARPKTLSASIVPVSLASTLAYLDGVQDFHMVGWILASALCIQIGTNFFNDYADAQTGADTTRLGDTRAVQAGLVSSRQMLLATLLFFGLAFVFGLVLIEQGGWPIAALGIASLICGYLYTGGPYPLAYVGLGDLFVFLFFGLGAVLGTYYLLASQITMEALWIAIQCGLISIAILVVNNTRDRFGDAKVDKNTLAVRLGRPFSDIQYTLCMFVPHLFSLALAYRGVTPAWTTLLLVPISIYLVWQFWRRQESQLNPLLGMTGGYLALHALLFFIGACLFSTATPS